MDKLITLGKNPKLSEMIAWAEDNGLELHIRFGNSPLDFVSRLTKRTPDFGKAPAKKRVSKSRKSTVK